MEYLDNLITDYVEACEGASPSGYGITADTTEITADTTLITADSDI